MTSVCYDVNSNALPMDGEWKEGKTPKRSNKLAMKKLIQFFFVLTLSEMDLVQ